jgi:ankyrin repeat protein
MFSFSSKDNKYIIFLAAYHNHPSVALVLLESNCAINKTDKQGWTALHWGIDRDHPEIVQLLIDKGARTDILSYRGESAASRAKSIRVKDIVKHIKRYSTLSLSLTDVNNILHHANSSPISLSPTEIEKLKKFTSSMSMTNVENTEPLIPPTSTVSTTRALSSTDV